MREMSWFMRISNSQDLFPGYQMNFLLASALRDGIKVRRTPVYESKNMP